MDRRRIATLVVGASVYEEKTGLVFWEIRFFSYVRWARGCKAVGRWSGRPFYLGGRG